MSRRRRASRRSARSPLPKDAPAATGPNTAHTAVRRVRPTPASTERSDFDGRGPVIRRISMAQARPTAAMYGSGWAVPRRAQRRTSPRPRTPSCRHSVNGNTTRPSTLLMHPIMPVSKRVVGPRCRQTDRAGQHRPVSLHLLPDRPLELGLSCRREYEIVRR